MSDCNNLFLNGLSNQLSVYYQNVRGLRLKTEDLFNNVACSAYDIVVFTETWLNDSFHDAELFDNRYVVYRRDREIGSGTGFHTHKKIGGGVLIAVSKHLSSKRMSSFESRCEDLWISLDIKDTEGKLRKLHICTAYLPSPLKRDVLLEFIKNSNQVIEQNAIEDVVFLGDFNLGSIPWDSLDEFSQAKTESNSEMANKFIEFVLLNDLKQYNCVPNFQGKILDLVLSSQPVIHVTECLSPLSKIDRFHPPIEFSFSFAASMSLPANNQARFCFYKADYTNLVNDLNDVDWDKEFSCCVTVDDMVSVFYKLLREAIAKHVPKSKPRSKKYPIWFSRDLINLLREKYKYHKKLRKYNNNPRDRLAFDLAKSRSNKLKALCYKQYLIRLECNLRSNPKLFWSFVKSKRNNTSHYPAQMLLGDKLAVGSKDICNLFAENFASVYNKSDTNTILSHTSREAPVPTNNFLTTIMFKDDQVLKILKRLDPSKGAGTDGIPSRFVIKCAPALAHPLCLIFNKSLSSGTFPLIWKKTLVVPLHKSGDKDAITNYRPISILPAFAKVFEKLVLPILSCHFKSIITTKQHGFTKSRSTVTNLVTFTNEVSRILDQRSTVGAIYTDFSKAFDKVDHQILLRKFSRYGVSGPLLTWCGSYLGGRSSVVVVNGDSSDPFEVSSGVPQGSHFGPEFFNIFINDIDQCFRHTKFLLFADDLKFFRAMDSSNDADKIQEDIHRLDAWCEENVMSLNVSKCFAMRFTRKIKPMDRPTFLIKNTAISNVDQIRDLGVTLDSKLRLHLHVDNIASTGFKCLGFVLRNSREFKLASTKIMLYNSLVRSGLEYCSVVWNPFYDVHKKRLESVQKRFMWHLTYSCYLGKELKSYNDRLKYFKMESLAHRRYTLDLLFLYKLANGISDTPDLLSELFLTSPRLLPRASRFNIFSSLNSRSNLGFNAPLARLVRQYNALSKTSDADIFGDSIFNFRKFLRALTI